MYHYIGDEPKEPIRNHEPYGICAICHCELEPEERLCTDCENELMENEK